MAKEPTKRRRGRGEGSVHKRKADGVWIGVVDLGWINGKRVRKTVSSKDKGTAIDKLAELKKTLAEHGTAPDAKTTVEKWLTYWLDSIAGPRVRPRTLESYRSLVKLHIVPAIGKKRLDQLAPQHVLDMNRALERRGLADSYVLKVHRTLAKALKDAQRHGKVTRNVATLIDAPKRGESVTVPLTTDDAKKFLASLDGDAHAGRWAMALLLGARQGECIGLEWERVDLDAGTVDISWQLQRLKFRHGCPGYELDPEIYSCGKTRAGSCPDRAPDTRPGFIYRPVAGGLHLTKPKSKERVIPLSAHMLVILRAIHTEGASGLIWTRPDGQPIDPKDDRLAWYAALKRAKVPPVKLHAARHTTATLQLELGTDPKVIESLLGHSSAVTTKGYLHVRQPLQRAAMASLDGLLAVEA